MAGEQQLGSIVYQVELEVGKLIESQRQVNARLDSMDKGFANTGRAADNTSKSFSSLTKVASGLAAALSVQQIAAYGNAWVTVSNKLVNSVKANEDLFTVTKRVFDISQDTRSSLEATATLYGRLERATRSAGTSTADLVKLTETINKGLTVSGATTEEASSTMTQLSQALASGVLRGEEFNSISENGSRLAQALAASLGVTIGQLRGMAAQGKLTTEVVVNGLLKQGDAIAGEFGKTVMTMSQSFSVATNNITKFVGESTTVKSLLSVFNTSIITVSENLDIVSAIIGTVAAVMGSRYVGALVTSTAAQIQSAAAAYRLAAAQGEVAVASKLASGALALVGGPAGAATLAAAAIFYFFQKSQQAKQEALDFADKLDGLISKMKSMSDIQLGAELAKTSQAIRGQTDAIADQQDVVDGLTKKVKDYQVSQRIYGESARQAANLRDTQEELAIETAKLEDMQSRQSKTISTANLLQAQLNGTLKQGADLLSRNAEAAGVAAGMMNHFGNALDFASRAKDKFNSSSLEVPRNANADKIIDSLSQENKLLSITDKRLRTVTESRMKAEKAGGNTNQIREAGELAGQYYDLQQAEAERNKTAKVSAKTTDEGAQKIADLQRQLQYLNLSYDENSREAAVYNAMAAAGTKATEAQKQEIGSLAGALFDAKQKQQDLNAAIAADPARNADKTYSDATKKLKRQYDEGIVDQQQFNQESLKLAQDHANAIAKANADAVVSPIAEAAGTVDPVQQLANENAKKLALIQQYEANKTITEQQGIALRNAANTQYEKARTDAMWQIWSQQSTTNQALAASFDSLANNASNAFTGILTSSMTTSEAMQSLLSNAINSLINGFTQMGVEWVKSAIMGQTAQVAATAATTSAAVAGTATTTAASVSSAAATTTAWTPAAIVASIGSFGGAAAIGIGAVIAAMALSSSIAGKRKNGGPVSAGSMYQVGEGGMPEIYQSSSGRQYMIPGDNGSVISNKDMQSGGSGNSGINVNVNITNTNGSYIDQQVTSDGAGGVTVDVIVADLDQGGPISNAITRNTSATRRATA